VTVRVCNPFADTESMEEFFDLDQRPSFAGIAVNVAPIVPPEDFDMKVIRDLDNVFQQNESVYDDLPEADKIQTFLRIRPIRDSAQVSFQQVFLLHL